MSTSSTRTPEEIVAGLREHVWTLLVAQNVPAAMTLLAAELPEWLEATAVPDPPLEGLVMFTGAELVLARESPRVGSPRCAPDQVNSFGSRVNDAVRTRVS